MRKTLFQWTRRAQILEGKVRGMKLAKSKNQQVCWAGKVQDLRAVRRARDEARWVTDRLARAVEWCDNEPVKKGGYSLITKSRS